MLRNQEAHQRLEQSLNRFQTLMLHKLVSFTVYSLLPQNKH
jgi:hypothetical protein